MTNAELRDLIMDEIQQERSGYYNDVDQFAASKAIATQLEPMRQAEEILDGLMDMLERYSRNGGAGGDMAYGLAKRYVEASREEVSV